MSDVRVGRNSLNAISGSSSLGSPPTRSGEIKVQDGVLISIELAAKGVLKCFDGIIKNLFSRAQEPDHQLIARQIEENNTRIRGLLDRMKECVEGVKREKEELDRHIQCFAPRIEYGRIIEAYENECNALADSLPDRVGAEKEKAVVGSNNTEHHFVFEELRQQIYALLRENSNLQNDASQKARSGLCNAKFNKAQLRAAAVNPSDVDALNRILNQASPLHRFNRSALPSLGGLEECFQSRLVDEYRVKEKVDFIKTETLKLSNRSEGYEVTYKIEGATDILRSCEKLEVELSEISSKGGGSARMNSIKRDLAEGYAKLDQGEFKVRYKDGKNPDGVETQDTRRLEKIFNSYGKKVCSRSGFA
ncbi:hypothetical protein FNU76_07320 [Chitinimonas arctica]|uniref:Uncharacterized protein n=1 Tax=Chitinimonas arctica TaxID=2594795 RepID=A0A516SDF1_9NEIS|nr:hypothetical protein [Chitinimonas arctica]QDQ26182.1 hypothetical protein FNU76_07320 [Chitinimonas arctica]